MKLAQQPDRRRFFRITDEIAIAYDIITDTEINAEPQAGSNQPQLDWRSLVQEHNDTINGLLVSLKDQQPLAAQAIEAINKKIDAVLRSMEMHGLAYAGHFEVVEDASISACGIAFPVVEAMETGTHLNMTLSLKPSDQQVVAVGHVVECESQGDDGYYLRVEFDEIEDADREKLIQHIVQRQGALLRSLREDLDP